MTAVPKDLYIEQGATFTMGWNWYHESTITPGTADLTNPYEPVSARMQIREFVTAEAVILAVTSDLGGGIVLGADGRFDVTLTDADTDLLTVASAVYDFEAVLPDGDVRRLLQGTITVDPNVTRT